MSESEGLSGVSRKRRSAEDLGAEIQRAYQEELNNAKSSGSKESEETLRQRAVAKVRSARADVDPLDLEQAAWQASQALRSLSKS